MPGTPRLRPTGLGPRPYPERLRWWAEGRFGLFIHWGPVSLKDTEISWSRANSNPKCPNNGQIPVEVYDNLYRQFNPTKFNAREWVAIAKAAGMKYMVLTAKHCDGFLLWDSQGRATTTSCTRLSSATSARELAKAAHEAGMRIGWYFSPMDWRDPDCRNEKNAEFVQPHAGGVARAADAITAALTCSGSTTTAVPLWDQERTYALVKKLQPQIVINNRLDLAQATATADSSPNADYYTPEQRSAGTTPAPVGIVHDALRATNGPGAGRGWGEALKAAWRC